jgi:hypothetical protein
MSRRFDHVLAVGVALAAISCSDPVPPAYKAGLRVNVTGSGACPSGAITQGIGEPMPQARGVNGKGGPIFDGEKGVKARCAVAGGPQFNVTATVSGSGISFNMSGSVSSSGTGTATIGLYSPNLAGQFNSASGGCTVTAVETAQGFQVKPGAIWAEFSCPTITGPIASEMCRLEGEVVLENCD